MHGVFDFAAGFVADLVRQSGAVFDDFFDFVVMSFGKTAALAERI